MKNQRFFKNELVRFANIVPAAAYNKKRTLFVVENSQVTERYVYENA